MIYVLMFLFPALGLFGALIYVFLLETGRERWAVWMLAGLGALSVYWSFFLVFGTNFFSRVLSCFTIPSAVVALTVFVFSRRRMAPHYEERPALRRTYRLGAALMPLLLFLPLAGEMGITAGCNRVMRRVGDGIVEAAESYREAEGAYPEEVGRLVPAYMEAVPEASCRGALAWFGQGDMEVETYEMETCREGATLLVVPGTKPEFLERYNFETGVWSMVSFLDGACSYLR